MRRRPAAITCSIEIAAAAEVVFDLIHDYERRLSWDSFLSKACLLDGAAAAAPGVTALCVAKGRLGKTAMETVYVTFARPSVAAVRMTRGPLFIASFAASIRHTAVPGGSRVCYRFRIEGWPRSLGFALDPLLARVFAAETRARLRALRRYVEGSTSMTMGGLVAR